MDGKWAEFAQAAGGSLTNWATPCIVLDRSNKIGKTINLNESRLAPPQPSECGRQSTLNIVHAQTAALQRLMEVMKPGCPGNVESGETSLS